MDEYGDLIATARDFVIAGTGALSGGTISVVIVQESALGVGLTAVAIFPVLIAALQGLIGFPLTSIILRKEAARLQGEYRAGRLEAPVKEEAAAASTSRLPAFLQNTPGTLFIVGLVVLASLGINNLTNGTLNTFVMALIFGIALRSTGVFKPSVLGGIDSLGLMMLAIMILVFGPLASVAPADVAALYGFPGTMILSQEAAKGAGETPEEVAAIEGVILPKMIVAGFSTVTITSVIVTSIIATVIGT